MLEKEYLKKQAISYSAIVLALILLTSKVSSFLLPYLNFMDFLGPTIFAYLINFISMLIILVPLDILLHKFYLKNG